MKVLEEIDFDQTTDSALQRRIRALEDKYGCNYREFLARGDFDHRPDAEWLDEMLWRILEEEMAARIDAALHRVSFPIRLIPAEA